MEPNTEVKKTEKDIPLTPEKFSPKEGKDEMEFAGSAS